MPLYVLVFLGSISLANANQEPFCSRFFTETDPSALTVDYLTPEESARPLSEVTSIYAPGGSDVTLKNIRNFIEPPLRNTIHMLLERNVPTNWASANKHHDGSNENPFDNGIEYTEIGLAWNGLSEENKAIVHELVPEKLAFPKVGELYRTAGGRSITMTRVSRVQGNSQTGLRAVWLSDGPGSEKVRIFLPTPRSETTGSISARWVEIAKKFQFQQPYTPRRRTEKEDMDILESVDIDALVKRAAEKRNKK